MTDLSTPETCRGIKVPEHLRNRGGSMEYAYWKLAVTDVLDTVVPLLEPFESDDPCSLDHHGYCQEHWFGATTVCPIAAVRDFLAAAKRDECVWQFGGMEWCFIHQPKGIQVELLRLTDALKDRAWSTCVQCGRELKDRG